MLEPHSFLLSVDPHLSIVLTLQPIHPQDHIIGAHRKNLEVSHEFMALCEPSNYRAIYSATPSYTHLG
jgi:hypothetical protein